VFEAGSARSRAERLTRLFIYDRPVHFEDVDAARIVFFPTTLVYCHEAMAAIFAGEPGGYAGLVVERAIGLPTVHLEVDYTAPLRFGDVAKIALTVVSIGRTSVTFQFDLVRVRDDVPVAKIKLVSACTDLATMQSMPWPVDVRHVLEAHLAKQAASG
jgi:4-hydroxybenzoyl-CoA thioesterase